MVLTGPNALGGLLSRACWATNGLAESANKTTVRNVFMRYAEGCRTVELTRRRESKHPPPHQVSYKTRSRRSRPTICYPPFFQTGLAYTRSRKILPPQSSLRDGLIISGAPPNTERTLLRILIRSIIAMIS